MNVGQLGMGLAIGWSTTTEREPLEILLITSAGAALMFAVVAVLAPRLLGFDLRTLFRPPRASELRLAAQAGVALWLISILVNVVNVTLFGPNPQALVVVFSKHEGAGAIALDMLAGAVVAPASEETLYRGILFAGLAQRYGFLPGAVVSAALFAVVHGLGVVLPILALGIGLAWVYQRTQTLWAPILTHSLVNAISLTVLFASRSAVAI